MGLGRGGGGASLPGVHIIARIAANQKPQVDFLKLHLLQVECKCYVKGAGELLTREQGLGFHFALLCFPRGMESWQSQLPAVAPSSILRGRARLYMPGPGGLHACERERQEHVLIYGPASRVLASGTCSRKGFGRVTPPHTRI